MKTVDEIIKAAVDKFLCWKLPKDFSPDSFISFDGKKHDTWGGYPNSWPTGTNLFNADQAREMFDQCLHEMLRSEVERVRRETVEECAKVCDQEAADADSAKRKPLLTPTGKMLYEGMWGGASNCAASIRGLLNGGQE